MAADILLYGASYVPVGDDQRQHLELCRDLGIRFNNKFGEIFTVPLAWNEQLAFYNRENGVRIRSLRTPDKKMSKSVADPAGTILLTDSPSEAEKKIMSATTDSFGEIQFDFKQRPGISNLLQILALLTNQTQNTINAEWQGKTAYGDLKKAVAIAVSEFLVAFQEKHAAVDDTQIIAKLEQSEATMRDTTVSTLLKVQQAVGLRPN
jgi:tryptophanyl-tRNA synthetase